MDPIRPFRPTAGPAADNTDFPRPTTLRRANAMVLGNQNANIPGPPALQRANAMVFGGLHTDLQAATRNRTWNTGVYVPTANANPPAAAQNTNRAVFAYPSPISDSPAPTNPTPASPVETQGTIKTTNTPANGQSTLVKAVKQNIKATIMEKVNDLASDMLGTSLADQVGNLSPLVQLDGESTRPNPEQVKTLLGLIRSIPGIPQETRSNLESQVKAICDLHDQLEPVINRKFTPYIARGGDAILVNPESAGQKPWIGAFINMISDETGIAPLPNQQLAPTQKKAIFKAWINIAVAIEDQNKAQYGQLRNQITSAELARLKGPVGVSMVMDQGAAVCRELSIIASAVLAEFGISSRVGSGTVFNNTNRPGAHVWLETLDPQGELEHVVDTNCAKDFFDSFKDYSKALKGVVYRQDGGGQQILVDYQVDRLYDAARI